MRNCSSAVCVPFLFFVGFRPLSTLPRPFVFVPYYAIRFIVQTTGCTRSFRLPHSTQPTTMPTILYVDRTPESQPTLFDPVVFIGQRAIHQINLFRFKMVSRPTRHHHRISIAMQWRTAHCLIVWIGALSWVICANVDFRWNSVAETATTKAKTTTKSLIKLIKWVWVNREIRRWRQFQ